MPGFFFPDKVYKKECILLFNLFDFQVKVKLFLEIIHLQKVKLTLAPNAPFPYPLKTSEKLTVF